MAKREVYIQLIIDGDYQEASEVMHDVVDYAAGFPSVLVGSGQVEGVISEEEYERRIEE